MACPKAWRPKRRVWREIHLELVEEALEITGSYVADAPVRPDLLSEIPTDKEIDSITADGAHDTRKCHDAVADRGAHAVIPALQERGEAMEGPHSRCRVPELGKRKLGYQPTYATEPIG